jgi:hypothetical protein
MSKVTKLIINVVAIIFGIALLTGAVIEAAVLVIGSTGLMYENIDIILKSIKYAFVFNIKILLIVILYFSARFISNTQRTLQNPSWEEKLKLLLMVSGTLAIPIFFISLLNKNDDLNGEFNLWSFCSIYFSAFPSVIIGLHEGFTMEKQFKRERVRDTEW